MKKKIIGSAIFSVTIAKALCLFAGILILGSCLSPAIAQEVWIRKGPKFYVNKEERKPKNATVGDNFLSQTDGSGRANTIKWSIPPERLTEGQQFELTLESTTNVAFAPLYGRWSTKDCARDTDITERDRSVTSRPGGDRGVGDKGRLVCYFKPSSDKPSMSVNAYRTDDLSGEMGVIVTWEYERESPGNQKTAPVPVSTSAQATKRECKKTFIVTGRRQYDGKLTQEKLVVTKRFYDWTDEELFEGTRRADGKLLPPGQIDSEEKKYKSGNYTPIKPRTKKQDCAGYVMDQLWQTGQYFVTAGAFSNVFIGIRKKDEAGNTIGISPGFAYKVSGEFSWGNLQLNDIVVYPGRGVGVGHIAIVKGFEKGSFPGGYTSIIIETKDGEERVYRTDLVEATSLGVNSRLEFKEQDPLINNYGTPEIWRVDPYQIRIDPLTPGECDEPGATTNTGGGNTGIGGTWTAPNGDVFELSLDNDRVTGSYRGMLGSGLILGSFNGKTLSGVVRIDQVVMSVSMRLTLRLTNDGRLEGQVGSDSVKVDLILTRR